MALLATLAVGCTGVQAGTALRDPRNDPRAVNTALLDPGGFATTPRTDLDGTAGTAAEGARLEARRMAEAVVVPFEVDLGLSLPDPEWNRGFTSPLELQPMLPKSVAVAIQSNNFIAGFRTKAAGPTLDRSLTNIVLRLATSEDARRAVSGMANGSEWEQSGRDGRTTPARRALPIPDRPDSVAFLAQPRGRADLFVYTTHGPFVLVQMVLDSGTDAALKLALHTVDRQRAALDSFEPTPVDELAALPMDPTGLLARSVPGYGRGLSPHAAGAYGPHGALHFMSKPDRARQVFTEAGVSAAAVALATVFQARDPDGAAHLVEQFLGDYVNEVYGRSEPVPGLPASRCLFAPEGSTPDLRLASYYCVVAYDKYVIVVQEANIAEAHRALAAQYLLISAE
ncbi:DUF7373 family lipoprotein [[Mycobacterium] wendilense]|uniref:Serine hydrolase n=1 Tax=[Mycobacterium] wendilense TaxID=3064284 RepID=A0ABM9M7U0_9MYCO|nr:hypothetical protein [Mycolicibacterium sp. MU0050]CAJ1578330.1 hypothetical protein MU0050_000029 [Mycolicibacterium sp. MU0050]